MTILSRWLKNLFIATSCLVMLSACTDDDGEKVPNVSGCYINLAISVSNGSSHFTRAGEKPTGGEDGDGREAGIERENTVTGITLILYQDGTGINTTSDPTLDLVRYFPVTERATGTMPIEVTYTTGPQALGKHSLDLTATYHAIVIANAPEVPASLTEGTSTLSDIRNVTLNTVYVGAPTALAVNCSNFVMSSEKDNTINFGSVTGTNLDGTPHTKGQDILYDVTGQPLVIERMAARVDFSTKYSTTDHVAYDASTYNRPGYVYRVWNSADIAANTAPTTSVDANRDHFVVVSITPFNLSNADTYVIKRNADDSKLPSAAGNVTATFAKRTASYVPQYLADETTTSWVLDTHSGAAKNTASYPSYITSQLDSYKTQATLASNPYNIELSSAWHVTGNYYVDSGDEALIVAYPKENTVDSDTPLYYYATGVAIEGIYYKKGTTTGGSPKVYYGFLRHQGESASSYDAFKLEGKDATETASLITAAKAMGCSADWAMNYGIVRNNIYRISIDKITEQGTVELKIKVKAWDPYVHAYIYM